MGAAVIGFAVQAGEISGAGATFPYPIYAKWAEAYAAKTGLTVVDCFTVDAILKSPVIDISGREEIRAFAGRFAAQRAAGVQFRHLVSNIAVTITENQAVASAYLLVLISKGGNHRSLPPGRYACE